MGVRKQSTCSGKTQKALNRKNKFQNILKQQPSYFFSSWHILFDCEEERIPEKIKDPRKKNSFFLETHQKTQNKYRHFTREEESLPLGPRRCPKTDMTIILRKLTWALNTRYTWDKVFQFLAKKVHSELVLRHFNRGEKRKMNISERNSTPC